jgi:hypothetical protein
MYGVADCVGGALSPLGPRGISDRLLLDAKHRVFAGIIQCGSDIVHDAELPRERLLDLARVSINTTNRMASTIGRSLNFRFFARDVGP